MATLITDSLENNNNETQSWDSRRFDERQKDNQEPKKKKNTAFLQSKKKKKKAKAQNTHSWSLILLTCATMSKLWKSLCNHTHFRKGKLSGSEILQKIKMNFVFMWKTETKFVLPLYKRGIRVGHWIRLCWALLCPSRRPYFPSRSVIHHHPLFLSSSILWSKRNEKWTN